MKMYLYIAAKTFNYAFYTNLPTRYDSQIFYFTMLFLDNSPMLQHHLYISGKSWLFVKLFYHTLEVDNHFNLPLKI